MSNAYHTSFDKQANSQLGGLGVYCAMSSVTWSLRKYDCGTMLRIGVPLYKSFEKCRFVHVQFQILRERLDGMLQLL